MKNIKIEDVERGDLLYSEKTLSYMLIVKKKKTNNKFQISWLHTNGIATLAVEKFKEYLLVSRCINV